MVIIVKTKKIINDFYEERKLTEKEMKLLMLLSDNERHTVKEIAKFLNSNERNVRRLIDKVQKIPFIEIKNNFKIGAFCNSTIEIY